MEVEERTVHVSWVVATQGLSMFYLLGGQPSMV